MLPNSKIRITHQHQYHMKVNVYGTGTYIKNDCSVRFRVHGLQSGFDKYRNSNPSIINSE